MPEFSPHHSNLPHAEKNRESIGCDSNVPSPTSPGPSENTFPGFAVHINIFPPAPCASAVTWPDSVLASVVYKLLPSSEITIPRFPVPSKSFPVGDNPSAYTRVSRELQSCCGEPSGASRYTALPLAVESGTNGVC